MECYRQGLDAKQTEHALKKYKRHRTIPNDIFYCTIHIGDISRPVSLITVSSLLYVTLRNFLLLLVEFRFITVSFIVCNVLKFFLIYYWLDFQWLFVLLIDYYYYYLTKFET